MKTVSSIIICLFFGFYLSSYSSSTVELAPEINLKNTKDVETSLSSLKGNVVLVDFWASWCKPCRMKHPELVGVYNQFKDAKFKNAKSFEIYSVSLDKNKANWIKAIEQDKLDWSNHVSELNGWQSEVVKSYGILGIPHNVLLNEHGVVIGKNLFGENLAKVLKGLQ